jgi:CRP-like cAMP-binding protein
MERTQSTEISLLRFELFKELEKDPAALKCLTDLVKYEAFKTHDYIIDEKLNDRRMFFLLKGQVEINKIDERGHIVVIGKTDSKAHPYFGESILFGDFKKSANVVAHSRCECLTLAIEDFEIFMDKHPSFVAHFYRDLSKLLFERLSKADKDIFIATIAFKKRNDRWSSQF